MDFDIVRRFEEEVKTNILSVGIDFEYSGKIAVAVSGGADSISLLTALCHILGTSSLFVITVNHNLREKEETSGDADFVQEYCRTIGVFCERVEIERGKIIDQSRVLSQSVEESARNFRYKIFENFVKKHNIDFLCLAHNKNDQLETLLMRFLTGGGTQALSGIRMKRDFYIRPILTISRQDIEDYLDAQHISYRTDSSNADNKMFRNRIRNVLSPELDELFPGWSKAVLSLSYKMSLDEEFLQKSLEEAKNRVCQTLSEGACTMSSASFLREPAALQTRLLFCSFDMLGFSGRVPFSFVKGILEKLKEGSSFSMVNGSVEVNFDGKEILIQKEKKLATERGFLVIISGNGKYQIDGRTVSVSVVSSGIKLQMDEHIVCLDGLKFPFVIRNRQSGDNIRNSSGSLKSVSSILTDWKCGKKRDYLPVVQRLDTIEQDIVCLWGECLGFDNWILKGTSKQYE